MHLRSHLAREEAALRRAVRLLRLREERTHRAVAGVDRNRRAEVRARGDDVAERDSRLRAAVEAAAWERTIGQDLFVDDPSGELPVLRTGEGLVMGEAMPIPSKIQFFKARDRPRGDDPEMPEAWRQDRPDGEHYAQAVKNWRYQRDTTEEGNENA